MLRRLLLCAIACLPLAGLAADKLIVGASPTPHAEILEHIKPMLARQGVDLEVRVFTDYIQPNAQLAEKRIDANFFQHQPFMNEYNRTRGTNLVKVADVLIAPFGAYSRKVKNVKDLRENAVVAIPNDAVNAGRALQLLHQAGVIQLSDPANNMATERDIVANPKRVTIKQFEAPMLPRTLSEVDLSIINTTFALEAKLDPGKDALFLEGDKSLFINLLAARPENKDSPAMKKLAAALRSPEARDYINTRFKGSLVPVF
jgi:D-methionine transport system substrate-binding protein